MSKNVVTLNFRAELPDIKQALSTSSHNGFPVVNNFNRLMGMMSREYLHVIIKKRCFSNENSKYDGAGHVSARHSLNSDYLKER